MRRQLFLFTFAAMLSVFLSGCIRLQILVSVAKNGAGTLIERVTFDSELLDEMLKGLPQGKMPKPWLRDEAKLKQEARQKGKGVEYVSSKDVSEDKWKGWEATYKFANVGHLSVDPSPGERAPSSPGQPPPPKKSDPMRFRFQKGKRPTLTVVLPRDRKGKERKDKPKKLNPSDPSFEMMAGMLKDMSVDISVEVDGKIVKTNATHRKKNRVTLMALDFNRLINDRKRLAEVLNAEDYSASARAFNKVKGMKIETRKKVRVSFR